MARPLDLTVVICAHRYITNTTFKSLELLRWHTHKTKMLYMIDVQSGDALIGRSRSVACTRFMEKGLSDYLLFVDDDIQFKPQDVEKIYEELSHGKDIVAGCYPVKRAEQLASWGNVKIDGLVHPCEYLATGFMGITLKALETIKEKNELPLLHPDLACRCYPFFESGVGKTPFGDPIYISEDWDFCEKAHKAGIETHLHTGVWVDHEGPTVWTVAEAIENMKKSGQVTEQDMKTE